MKDKERERLSKLIAFDSAFDAALCVYGMDEVGRGPLAGPVVAACVQMPQKPWIEGIKDSKKIAEARRETIAALIRDQAICYAIGSASVEEIEALNILGATKLAMQRAYGQMPDKTYPVLIDAIDPAFLPASGQGIVKGDAQSYTIAAASIVAKVERDARMKELDAQYPAYGFARNKGYGTKEHIAALRLYGPCPHHRPSFIQRILHGR